MSSDESKGEENHFEVLMKKGTKKKRNKTGRELHWPKNMVNNLVIILENKKMTKSCY